MPEKSGMFLGGGSLWPSGNAFMDRVAREVGASCAFLLLTDQKGTSEPRSIAWYGHQETPDGYVAVARWVLSRVKPLCLQQEADAKEIVGCDLDRSVLPLICVPVQNNAGLQGVLLAGALHENEGNFSHRLSLLGYSAELAGALLENAILLRELSHREEQVRELIRDTLSAQEAERERIGLEVHDGVTQTLASVFQYLQTLETTLTEGTLARQLLIRASSLVRQAIQESREVINSLQPATLKDLGLVATLRQEMRQMEQETRWAVDFKTDAIRLPVDVEIGLYRIIREAITNVKKHANSRRLRVMISAVDDQVEVEVRDWGIGFESNIEDTSIRRGTGLFSMRKRAELLQGTFDIQSSPGQGTTVRVQVPIGTPGTDHG